MRLKMPEEAAPVAASLTAQVRIFTVLLSLRFHDTFRTHRTESDAPTGRF